MRLENLKSGENVVLQAPAQAASAAAAVAPVQLPADDQRLPERHVLELALLTARVKHLELVVETARSLMNSNQERLLRRLYEIPGEITEIVQQLRRLDGPGSPSAL